MSLEQFISLDLPPLLAALFCATACAIIGNYLVLRKLRLMGDAISHSVLPGIVVAFLLTSERGDLPVFLGAATAGILSAMLIEFVRRFGRVESGAAMGVVFSIFFALGVLLIEQAAARSVDLDADCLLHGQLEGIFWFPPQNLLSLAALSQLPPEVFTSFVVFVAVSLFVVALYKELKLCSFDAALADSLGFNSSLMHQLLMIMVACAVVASFKVVGSILVIAMIICPGAAARLWTNKLSNQIWISAALASLSVIMGYVLAAFGPQWLGYQNSVNAAGMISVVSGIVLGASIIGAPKHGILARKLKQKKMSLKVRAEDILGMMYRLEEHKDKTDEVTVSRGSIIGKFGEPYLTDNAIQLLLSDRKIALSGSFYRLSEEGRRSSKEIVRSHRLWETYLVEEAGIQADHVHSTAERLEHASEVKISQEVYEDLPSVDPHGKKIPQ